MQIVSYLRVSTARQGASGLGLEAQRASVASFAAGNAHTLVAEFVEVESGATNARPQLTAALASCRLHRATLVIAKLDRLARNVAFIANLMDGGVEFVACDMPHANRLTLHLLAAIAEHEHVPEIIAAEFGSGVVQSRAGRIVLKRYFRVSLVLAKAQHMEAKARARAGVVRRVVGAHSTRGRAV